MPVYEYECISCGSRFDKRQGFEEKPEAFCPKCQCPVKRVIRPAPIIFKGSGFYVTDCRKPDTSGDGGDKASATAPAPVKSEAAVKGNGGHSAPAKSESVVKDSGSAPAPAKTEAAEKSGKK